jgi:hypothetical protein
MAMITLLPALELLLAACAATVSLPFFGLSLDPLKVL